MTIAVAKGRLVLYPVLSTLAKTMCPDNSRAGNNKNLSSAERFYQSPAPAFLLFNR
jgi:hypothetical protein